MSLKATPEQAREHSIEAWMLTKIRDGGVVRMDDLHVDKIDEAWKPRECWVQSGLEAFRMASMSRDRHHLPFTVALGFSLESGEHFTGVDFQNTTELFVICRNCMVSAQETTRLVRAFIGSWAT